MEKIKAAVCHAFGAPLVIEDISIRPPEGSEVEVTLDAVAICHSDISYMDGDWGGSLPAVYGHEAAGRITRTGGSVKGLSVGDPVVVTLIRACQSCPSCASGSPVTCTTPYDGDHGPITTTDGGKLHQAMATGGFAERVVVEQSQVVKLPDGMAMDVASLLACGVITGVGAAVNAANIRPGEVVVIIGAGGVGLNAIQGARIAGAARIIAIDMSEDKLDAAIEFGATDGILATSDTPWKAAYKAAGRGADAVLVTVGAIPAYDAAPRYLAPGGKVVMVGMPHSGGESRYEPVILAALGQGMVGSKMGDVVIQRDIPWMIDLYQQGRLKLDELISGRWRLDQINEAIADTKSGAAHRNVIVFDRD
ncbi:alcohol dehydrogenase catalytic domain-containing protein [Aliiroseovarius sp. S1339]|uniref:zinc-binding dehydrogenase n=1 Tax=Aliiroseovarius sp. S1339 TaxID=2936990 RepID=UPI0020C11915|nr:zinc-binding dehydrogenase [Aliiroseovarius sp. S1339]MCK8465368.1 alcohol dehydrogenase catalytic domain-containing protein [Aliiroseovarius sp. S1339]